VPFHEVIALHNTTPIRINGVTPVKADLRHARDRERIASLSIDAVIHMACKIQAWAPKGMSRGEAARKVNQQMMDTVLSLKKPVVYASSTVVHWDRDTPYAQSRREDEQRLEKSGLRWAVLRPSAPYGRKLVSHKPQHRESFHTLAELVRRSPLVPVIGDGKYRRQPIHLDDFSDAILRLLEDPLPNRAFDAGGAEALSFDGIVDTIASALGRSVTKLHLPKALFVTAARVNPDFDPDLIAAVDEDEVADPTELSEATGVRFRTFAEGVRCLI
jgi:NADH dehydrogenase